MPPRRRRPRSGTEGVKSTGEGSTSSVLEVPPEWVALADVALAGCGFAEGSVRGVGIVAVSDLVLTEAIANGRTLPAAPALMRGDGRTVSFFRLPGGGR